MEMEKKEVGNGKRGRKPKNENREYKVNTEQTKFFVDLSKDIEVLSHVHKILSEANTKEFGQEVIFKDIALYAIGKICKKDIEKIQENSLSEMEKVERSLIDYNLKNGTSLKLGEYLLKKLNLN